MGFVSFLYCFCLSPVNYLRICMQGYCFLARLGTTSSVVRLSYFFLLTSSLFLTSFRHKKWSLGEKLELAPSTFSSSSSVWHAKLLYPSLSMHSGCMSPLEGPQEPSFGLVSWSCPFPKLQNLFSLLWYAQDAADSLGLPQMCKGAWCAVIASEECIKLPVY